MKATLPFANDHIWAADRIQAKALAAKHFYITRSVFYNPVFTIPAYDESKF